MKTYTVEVLGVPMQITRDVDGKFIIPDGWRGLGSALKPANEPCVLARKPLSEKSIAANVLRWGTGALNIDGCRVAHGADVDLTAVQRQQDGTDNGYRLAKSKLGVDVPTYKPEGRWPANLVHSGCPEVLAGFPETGGDNGSTASSTRGSPLIDAVYGDRERVPFEPRGDSGSAARFFASFPEEPQQRFWYGSKADGEDRLGSLHPTVKPIGLLQWLCRLVCPPGGTVLDCFAGTGTTGEAAWREGMNAILIEREEEYQADIARRMELAVQPTKRAAVAATKNNLDDPNSLPLFAERTP